MSCCVLYTLNLPVGVIIFGSLITVLSLRVLSSITTIADGSVLPAHTENQTSEPSALYSACTARCTALVLPSSAILAMLMISGFLSRFLMSYTVTDSATSASGLSGASAHRFLDFGWVLTNSEPPPWFFSSATTFQAYCL